MKQTLCIGGPFHGAIATNVQQLGYVAVPCKDGSFISFEYQKRTVARQGKTLDCFVLESLSQNDIDALPDDFWNGLECNSSGPII